MNVKLNSYIDNAGNNKLSVSIGVAFNHNQQPPSKSSKIIDLMIKIRPISLRSEAATTIPPPIERALKMYIEYWHLQL